MCSGEYSTSHNPDPPSIVRNLLDCEGWRSEPQGLICEFHCEMKSIGDGIIFSIRGLVEVLT